MKNFKFDNKNACLVFDDLTSEYLIGAPLEEGCLVVADKKTCFIDARSFLGVRESLVQKGVEVKLFKTLADIRDFLTEIGTKNLYLDFSKVSVKKYNELLEFGLRIKDAEEILNIARAIKNEREIENLTKACDIAQKALYKGLKVVREGITELELKNQIENYIIEFGGSGPSFETIVAFGKNGAIPHHKSGEEKLKENSAILIDMGAKYNGYCSDITRTLFFGTPTQKFVKCYNVVLRANEKAIANIKCGTLTNKADAFARDLLQSEGLGEYFTHSLGHGVGMEIHEFPYLSPRQEKKLKQGMAFTIEPGVYLENEFGIRIEDTVLLTNNGVKRLFTDSKELKIIK